MLSKDTKATTFAIADTKLYIPVVTLSNQDNAKLLEQLNKYDPKVSVQAPNLYLDFLIKLNFEGVNRISILSFENKDDKILSCNCRNKGL